MRYAWAGFHIGMLLLLALAFGGYLDLPSSGNFAQDGGNRGSIIIGVIVLWIIGSIVFRMIRRFSRY